MRILVGTTEIGGLISIFADGLRKLGNQVTTVVVDRHPLYPEAEYDIDLRKSVLPWPEPIRDNASLFIRLPRGLVNRLSDRARIAWLIGYHDVFIYQWVRRGIFPENRELPLLKKLGKKIVSLVMGSDIRNYPAYKQWYVPMRKHLNQLPFSDEPLASSLRSIRMTENYSNVIFSQPNQSILAIRPYMHLFIPIDLSKYRFIVTARDIPVVVHAPSRKWLKGTNLILEAVNQLKREGIKFDFRLLDGVPNQKVIGELANADVLIDELFFPLHGTLTLEALASGCAVANGDDEDYEPFPPNRPIWHIRPKDLQDQLRQLFMDKELRIRLAFEGRRYVEQYYDHVKVAKRIIDILKSKRIVKYDHYPTFFSSEYELHDGEVIPEDLKVITAQIVRKWGLPKNLNPQSMVARRLMIADVENKKHPIQRWEPGPVSTSSF